MKCSYCNFDMRGGVVFDPEHPRALGIWDDNADARDFYLIDRNGEERFICDSCRIKIFDRVLGVYTKVIK